MCHITQLKTFTESSKIGGYKVIGFAFEVQYVETNM